MHVVVYDVYLYRHFQKNEKTRRLLNLPQKIVDGLRSKSSPVTQVGIGMGTMFVDLCSTCCCVNNVYSYVMCVSGPIL